MELVVLCLPRIADYGLRVGRPVVVAREKVADPDAVWYYLDPSSWSRRAGRVIGYSWSAGRVLAAILLAPVDQVLVGHWRGRLSQVDGCSLGVV